MTYFSEREQGERPCDSQDITEVAWGGIQALVRAGVDDGSFGATYPDTCPDGAGPVGTDASAFWQAMRAENPNLKEPPWYYPHGERPPTLGILDMIEFCWRVIGKPVQGSYHGYFSHHHLSFDVKAGRDEFRDAVNRILRRNGLAYELTSAGTISRLAPTVLREELASAHFRTGDAELDRLLETARRKFLDPDEAIRREALETLWDAWERLKTLGPGADKKAQITALLDSVSGAGSPKFREALEREARELTWIGNNLSDSTLRNEPGAPRELRTRRLSIPSAFLASPHDPSHGTQSVTFKSQSPNRPRENIKYHHVGQS